VKTLKKYNQKKYLEKENKLSEACVIHNLDDALNAISVAFAFIASKKRLDLIDAGAEAIITGVKNTSENENLLKKILNHVKTEITYVLNKKLLTMPESSQKDKYKTLKETSYSVNNAVDAQETISDLSSFIIAKYPEPKSLWIISTSIINSLQAMFPNEAQYKAMKRKVAQAILNLD